MEPTDHQCPWRVEVDELRRVVAELTIRHQRELHEHTTKLAATMSALEAIERRLLGPMSEKIKMPPPAVSARPAKGVSVLLPATVMWTNRKLVDPPLVSLLLFHVVIRVHCGVTSPTLNLEFRDRCDAPSLYLKVNNV